jgi:hypothetical protein
MKKKKLKFAFLLLGLFLMASFTKNFNINTEKYVEIPHYKPGTADFNDIPITSLTIGNNVTNIGKNAFSSNAITSVIIGNSVTNIGEASFFFNALTSVTIGDNVTNIGNAAFASNKLTSITIPNSVASIGSFAFSPNPLTQVIAKGTTPASIFINSFGTRSNIDLTVPEGTMGTYLAAGWTGFRSINEESTLSTVNITINSKDVSLIIADNQLSIKAGRSQLLHYSIYNMSGVAVLSDKQDTISIAHLSSGVYIAVLTFDSGVISKKFAK